MECLEARRWLAQSNAQGHGSGNDEARAHLRGCAVCRTVLALVPSPPKPREVSARLRQLQVALQREQSVHGWLQARPRWVVATVAGLQAVAALSWVVLTRPRPDLQAALHPMRWGWLGLAALLLISGLGWAARSSFRPQVPRVLTWGLLLLVMGATAVGQLLQPAVAASQINADFWWGAWRCFAFGGNVLLPTAAWILLTHRGPGMPVGLRIALGAALGLVALMALELHCPSPELPHRLLGHGAVVAAFAVLAGLRR